MRNSLYEFAILTKNKGTNYFGKMTKMLRKKDALNKPQEVLEADKTYAVISGFTLRINWCWCILSANITVTSCMIPARIKLA